MHFLCRRLATIFTLAQAQPGGNNAGTRPPPRPACPPPSRGIRLYSFLPPPFPTPLLYSTCEFIAAINEYVCSNKPIFYVQKSREKLFSTVKSHGRQAGRGGYQGGGGLKRRRRNWCNFVPGTVKRNPTLFLHKYYRSVTECACVCVSRNHS